MYTMSPASWKVSHKNPIRHGLARTGTYSGPVYADDPTSPTPHEFDDHGILGCSIRDMDLDAAAKMHEDLDISPSLP